MSVLLFIALWQLVGGKTHTGSARKWKGRTRPGEYRRPRTSVDVDPERYVKPSQEALRRMVGPNPRFLVKDNWATYGYNNVRYMFESTLNLAQIADRIPVIPDSAWARTCAGASEDCTAHSLQHFSHRRGHSEMGKDWNEDGEAWKIGIEEFVDIPHLRKTYGTFLTLSEFFTLYDIPSSRLDPSGKWDPIAYNPTGLNTEVLDRDLYEFDIDFVRVDRPLKDSNYYPLPKIMGLFESVIRETRGWMHVWSLDKAKKELTKLGIKIPLDDDRTLMAAMYFRGQAPLYTFDDSLLMSKALALPSIDMVQRNRIRPFTGAVAQHPFGTADIVYLPGDLHDQRKAGGLRFTTPEGRQAFIDMVLKGVRPPKRYRILASRLAKRMRKRVEGRRWCAAHMRRGDFLGIDWSPDATPEGHLNKTMVELERGIEVMRTHDGDKLPLPGDPFYLATDDEDPKALALYRMHGAVLLTDLLTKADRAELGWQASFNDLLALVEQEVLASADYFVGSKFSSTTGGAINFREARGMPSWSWSLLEKGG